MVGGGSNTWPKLKRTADFLSENMWMYTYYLCNIQRWLALDRIAVLRL